jgi:hypothetical protein
VKADCGISVHFFFGDDEEVDDDDEATDGDNEIISDDGGSAGIGGTDDDDNDGINEEDGAGWIGSSQTRNKASFFFDGATDRSAKRSICTRNENSDFRLNQDFRLAVGTNNKKGPSAIILCFQKKEERKKESLRGPNSEGEQRTWISWGRGSWRGNLGGLPSFVFFFFLLSSSFCEEDHGIEDPLYEAMDDDDDDDLQGSDGAGTPFWRARRRLGDGVVVVCVVINRGYIDMAVRQDRERKVGGGGGGPW